MWPLSHLSLLEGLSCQVASAGSLEQAQVPLGLLIPLLLQLSQGASSEEQLEQKKKKKKRQTHTEQQISLLAEDTIIERSCNAYFSPLDLEASALVWSTRAKKKKNRAELKSCTGAANQ